MESVEQRYSRLLSSVTWRARRRRYSVLADGNAGPPSEVKRIGRIDIGALPTTIFDLVCIAIIPGNQPPVAFHSRVRYMALMATKLFQVQRVQTRIGDLGVIYREILLIGGGDASPARVVLQLPLAQRPRYKVGDALRIEWSDIAEPRTFQQLPKDPDLQDVRQTTVSP